MIEMETLFPVVYAQLGLLLLAYLVYRRMGDLRFAVDAAESGRDHLARGLEKALAELERRLEASEEELGRRRAKRAVRRVSGLKRRRALERLQSGESAARVAQEFGLRPPEAEFLARLAASTGPPERPGEKVSSQAA